MKKIISIALAAAVWILPAQVFAEAAGPITYERAATLMRSNNSTLKKQQPTRLEAWRKYSDYEKKVKDLDVLGTTVEREGTEKYILYDPETVLSMRRMKELTPQQLKFSWETVKNTNTITANTYEITLRQMFLALYNADALSAIAEKQLESAESVHRRNKIKYENGDLTLLGLLESEYLLLKAQKGVDGADRYYENALRNLNRFIGLPNEMQFSQIIYSDRLAHPKWETVDYYIDKALADRFDIVNVRRRIALMETEKEFLELGLAYRRSTAALAEYERVIDELELLYLEMQLTELSITAEIKNAYADVTGAGAKIDILHNKLQMEYRNYTNTAAKHGAEIVSDSELEAAKLGYMLADNEYKAALYDYNTRIMRFNNATGAGPGY